MAVRAGRHYFARIIATGGASLCVIPLLVPMAANRGIALLIL
jgi:hypothetical protein